MKHLILLAVALAGIYAQAQQQVAVNMRFAPTYDTSISIISVTDAAPSFTVIITTSTPTLNQIDSLRLRLTTPQGEFETIWALETSANSGQFVVAIPFGFNLMGPTMWNGTVEGRLNPAIPFNSIPVNVVVYRTQTDSAQAMITLFSTFVPATGGYVKDLNGDGRADAVYLEFAAPINLPAQIDSVYWNANGLNGRRATNLQLLANGTVLFADLLANPFPGGAGMTGIPTGGAPEAVLPVGAAFWGARVPLKDSVGAVPLRAFKRPSDLKVDSITGLLKPDTIEITVSEPINRTTASWDRVFLFSISTNCADPAAIQNARAIPVLSVVAAAAGTVFTLEVSNFPGSFIPLVGNCIFLDTTGRILDGPGNKSGLSGVPLGGSDPILILAIHPTNQPVIKIPMKAYDLKGRRRTTLFRSSKEHIIPKSVIIR